MAATSVPTLPAIRQYSPFDPPLTPEQAKEITRPLLTRDSYIPERKTMFGQVPNPVLRAILPAYTDDEIGHVITGEGAENPTVWIVVPFQASPTGDGVRLDQKKDFITHMGKLREHLAEKGIHLRVRFAEQAYTGFRRVKGQHPLAERDLIGSDSVSTPKFNRGAILNAVLNTITHGQCVFTHDVDLVPVHTDSSPPSFDAYADLIPDDEILHLAGGWERYNRDGSTSFGSYLGGIAGMTPAGWRRINGYPNDFFGWGGEDDELRNRINEQKIRVIDTYYDKTKFELRDLEGLTMEDKLSRVQSSVPEYNIIKNELVELHRKSGGLGLNGLNDIGEMTRIISWRQDADHPWIDTMKVAVLPTAYPVLPPETYKDITDEKLHGKKSNASYRALARYGALVSVGYNWSTGETSKVRVGYDAIRAPEVIYGSGKRPDHKNIKRWRLRLSGLRDVNGREKRRFPGDSKHTPLYKHVWLDPTGAFSISYPETADRMAMLLASLVPAGSSIIDMTACVGGNTMYFSYYFHRVTAIEIAPHRNEMLVHNIQLLHQGREETVQSIPNIETLINTPADSRPNVSILTGDSHDVLVTQPSTFQYDALVRSDPLAQVLFLDPPWGGPNYMYLPRPLKLEMITRSGRAVSAAEFIAPILGKIREEQTMLPKGKGVLSAVKYIGMKVPDEYDIEGLRETIARYNAVATDPFLIPDNTKRGHVFLIVMTLL